jgi:hypothetical protein
MMKMKRCMFATAPILSVCLLLASGANAAAQSAVSAQSTSAPHSGGGRCSNRTLSGDYAGQFAGTILGPDIHISGVGTAHYDGKGGFTGLEHIIFNGFAPATEWTPSSGTYTVNPDCTGRSVTYSSNTPPEGLVQYFVLVNNGQERRGLVEGNAFASVDFKVSPGSDLGGARCSNRTLSGEYAAQIVGTILGPNLPIRGLASARYDGRGNLKQVDHIVTGGVVPAEEWTPGYGTYSVNPDCTGSAVIFSQSSPDPLNLHFVIVKNGTEIHQVVDANAVTAVAIKVR